MFDAFAEAEGGFAFPSGCGVECRVAGNLVLLSNGVSGPPTVCGSGNTPVVDRYH